MIAHRRVKLKFGYRLFWERFFDDARSNANFVQLVTSEESEKKQVFALAFHYYHFMSIKIPNNLLHRKTT
jgi:hypothetical protein